MSVTDPESGYQHGEHKPKAGCWGCVEAFAESIAHWADELGDCDHPEDAGARRAFAAWADRLIVWHAHDLGDDEPVNGREAEGGSPVH